MLSKIEYLDRDDTSRPYAYAEDASYNAVPPNLRLISEDEFSRSDFFTYTPVYMEFRQVRVDNGLLSLRMFYMPAGHGYAVHSHFAYKKVSWYRFGCEHSYRELSRVECQERKLYHGGNCYHVTECRHCGYIHSYDSGG